MAGRWSLVGVTAMVLVTVAGCSKAKPVSTEPKLAAPTPAKSVSTELKLTAKVRPSGDSAAKWVELCTTPGPVEVAAGQELGLEPVDPGTFGDTELKQLAVDLANTNLTTLWLGSCEGVTDAGLAHLAELTNLTRLALAGTGVTDAGLAHLAGLTNLTMLTLAATSVTDAGLAHLAGLTNLTILNLRSTGVTDAGLAHLTGLTNLKTLDLTACDGVTDAGVAVVKEKLPRCEVTR